MDFGAQAAFQASHTLSSLLHPQRAGEPLQSLRQWLRILCQHRPLDAQTPFAIQLFYASAYDGYELHDNHQSVQADLAMQSLLDNASTPLQHIVYYPWL